MTDVGKQFVSIIRAAIGTGDVPSVFDWSAIWKLACRHRLEALISQTVKDTPGIPDDIRKAMQRSVLTAIAKETKLDYAAKQIESALSSANIPFAALKGLVLKNDYPASYMRYMSDLDYYIKPEDKTAIRRAMDGLGGKLISTDSGDEGYLLFDWVVVEFHGTLLYEKKRSVHPYAAWGFVDSSQKKLTEEGFALNLIGHAVFDLSGAGPGIRYVLDQWIYKNRHKPQPDWEAVNGRLMKDGIYKAASNIYGLAEYLFGEGEETPLYSEMADYVLKSGLYGNMERKAASEAAQSGGRLKAAWRQVFRNRKEFENRYVWVKKHPYLLPAAWVLRGVQSVKTHAGEMKKWNKRISGLSDEDVKKQKVLLEKFGIL
ncbi:MAG: nucleotidyltransferase family protein [Clostridia bacterium]|nr:nucleotidyltransferase family protein [Clostridia bacterium]